MLLDYLSISKYNINRFIVTCIINSFDKLHQLLVLLLHYFNYIILISYNLCFFFFFYYLLQSYYENYLKVKSSTSKIISYYFLMNFVIKYCFKILTIQKFQYFHFSLENKLIFCCNLDLMMDFLES